MKNQFNSSGKIFSAKFLLLSFTLCVYSVLASIPVYAQIEGGTQGITDATQKVKGYFNVGCDLMYAIGAIVGIIGAVKVYNKWNAGESDTNKVAAAWFGSCIFLVVVSTILKGFFQV